MLSGPGAIEIIEVEPSPVVAGSLLVAIDRCGVGGPDIEAWSTGVLPSPAWFGHEWVGRVVAVGEGVEGHYEGERVVGATAPPCGRCRACAAGLAANCERCLALILGTDPLASPHGAFAELIRVDADRVHRAPDGIDDAAAALTEPAAVAAHAVARSGQRLGDLVAVVGAGTIGLLTAELARLAGASRVIAIDTEPGRGELACSLGADAAFVSEAEAARWLVGHGHGLGADVVYECAGGGGAVGSAVSLARVGGSLVLVGGLSGAGDVVPAELVAKELTISASLGYTVADVHRALELMADDRIRVDAIIDRVVGFGDLASVFGQLADSPSAGRKVLFSPQPG